MTRGKWRLGVGVAGVAAVAVAVLLWPDPPPDLGVTVDEVQLIGVPTLDGDVRAFVTVTNRTPRPVRVLGNEVMSCGDNCCFAAERLDPTDLWPGQSVVAEYKLLPRGVGPFSTQTDLFVQRDGRTERVTIPFAGVILPGSAADH